MNKGQKELIELLNGEEFVFNGEVVGVEGFNLISAGRVFEAITSKNYKAVVDAFHMQEYGTTDFKQIMAMEGF